MPLSMMGKMGSIHAGVMDCNVNPLPVNSKWYCSIAVENVMVTYIQKRIRKVVISHGPVEGTPYSCMPDRMVEILRKKV